MALRLAPLAVMATLAAGCVSHHQLLVDPRGNVANCDYSGFGLFGMIAADTALDSCVQSRKAAGYVEVQRAGGIGIMMREDSTTILRVSTLGPSSITFLLHSRPLNVRSPREGDPRTHCWRGRLRRS